MLFFSPVQFSTEFLFTVHCFTLMNSNGKEPTNPSDCWLGESGLRPLWSLCWVTHCSVCRSASLLHSCFCSVVWSQSVKSASSTAVCTDLGPHQTRLLRHCWDMNNNTKVACFFQLHFYLSKICLIEWFNYFIIISWKCFIWLRRCSGWWWSTFSSSDLLKVFVLHFSKLS